MRVFSLLLIFTLYGCSAPKPLQNTESWTKHDLDKALDLKLGDSPDVAIALLGTPIFKELEGVKTALQWCRTDATDTFVTAFFYQQKLVATRNYTNNSGYGDCKYFYKPINWTFKPADQTIEYRFR